MGICAGCREEFSKEEIERMKHGYCKDCFELLNLKDNSAISAIDIAKADIKEETKLSLKNIIIIVLVSLGIIGIGVYIL